MKTMVRVLVGAAMLAAAAGALAQPEIISLGDGANINSVNNGGARLFGAAAGSAARWDVSAGSVVLTALPGSSASTGASDSAQYAIGLIPNSAGLGGLPTTATLGAR